ncbi:MAG: oxygenase MpaB family protein [Acidimicrobiales bacterium]
MSDRPEMSPALRATMMDALGLAPAGANVVMQLSRLAVGHGVANSRVESGALTRHPIKRTRTTLGYIMASLLGDEEMREFVRREVNRQHRDVHSLDGDVVAYNAFDPELQLWVAACMYRGVLDAVTMLDGAPSDQRLEEIYRHCSRFATTLQVDPQSWPESPAAFEEYWENALEQVAIDDTTRTYLRGFVRLNFLPTVLSAGLGPLHEFITAGFLTEHFRNELGLTWDDRRQRRFELLRRTVVQTRRVIPRVVREFPLNVVWWDTQRRFRRGRPFV